MKYDHYYVVTVHLHFVCHIADHSPCRSCLLHRSEFGDNSESVSDMLVKVVLDVQYSLHQTLKKDSEFAR